MLIELRTLALAVVADVAFHAKGRDGIEVSMRFVHVWTVRQGQIVRFRGFSLVRGGARSGRLTPEQRRESLAASLQVLPVGLGVAARASVAPRGKRLVRVLSLFALARCVGAALRTAIGSGSHDSSVPVQPPVKRPVASLPCWGCCTTCTATCLRSRRCSPTVRRSGSVLGGDYASFGAWPVETVERLRELDAEWIRGNVDRWLRGRARRA